MATTITKDTKDITFAGSPQFITAKDVFLAAQADNFFVFLRIWSGDKTAIPVDVTVDLFLPAIFVQQDESGYETKVTFEISKYLEDYINAGEYVPSSGTIPYNGSAAVWYNYEVSATGSGGGNSPVTSATKLATSGRGLIEDGSNPGTTVASENGKIFGKHSRSLVVDPNGEYMIPIYVGDDSTNVSLDTKTQVIGLATDLSMTLNSIDSNEQIGYVFLNKFILGSEWEAGNEICLSIINSTTALDGISFNASNQTYMNLGIVPMLNSLDSYVKTNFVAFNWDLKKPFGYDNGGNDNFWFYRINAQNKSVWSLQNGTGVDAPQLVSSDSYQETEVTVSAANELGVTIAGDDALLDAPYTNLANSGLDFYLGCYNQGGTAVDFTSSVFTDIEFYNGVTTKTFNHANNWNGAINYGGKHVVSYDAGLTWNTPNEYEYCINVECSKGEPMVLKYINLNGVLDTLPMNGINKENIVVKKTNYQNYILDTNYDFNPLSHLDKTFTSNGGIKFTLGTGWIRQESNDMVKELLISKLAWLETSEGIYPVQIDTNTLQMISRTWNKKFDYSFNATVSTPLLNNIL
jgi:hypothetical protein